ncbi:MAG: hypothetical protein ABF991_00290 [Liquorilactobacillus hordei]|uniref:hypothetical protein n=1 Tax=Liquorilactobacillus hordei TaxID=468911 RepID=UPI0039E7697E
MTKTKKENSKKYEVGDKIVVKVKNIGENFRDEQLIYVIEDGSKDYRSLNEREVLGKLEDFTPKQEKIKMTVGEKKEFDELKETYATPYGMLHNLIHKKDLALYRKVFMNANAKENSKEQLRFIKAFEHPELIEVDYEFKIGNSVIVDTGNFKTIGVVVGVRINECFKVLFKSGLVSPVSYKKMKLVKENAIDWEDQNGECQEEA